METNELLKKIRRLEIKAKGLTKHIFSGEYHSAFKGRGMAFSEVRDYQFGDEVRAIDWNVTARQNNPYIKVFEEERELSVMLIVDVSGSEQFGSTDKSKKDLSLETMAILAFSALSNNDRVGCIFVSDEVERYYPPKKGRKHVLYLLREYIQFKAKSKKTDLNEGLKFFRNTQKKRCICFVISDFIDEKDFVEGLKITRKKHDVIALRLEDPFEYELPKMGFIQLYNAESDATTWVNTNDEKFRKNYREKHLKEQETLSNKLTKIGVDFAILNTTNECVLPLVQLFKNR